MASRAGPRLQALIIRPHETFMVLTDTALKLQHFRAATFCITRTSSEWECLHAGPLQQEASSPAPAALQQGRTRRSSAARHVSAAARQVLVSAADNMLLLTVQTQLQENFAKQGD